MSVSIQRFPEEQVLPRQMTDPMTRSRRIEEYYNLVFGAVQKLGIERARLVTQAYKEFPSHYNCMRRAYALDKVLRNYKIFIEPHTLLVGNQTEHGPGKHAPLFPEVYGSELAWTELVDGKPCFPWERPDGRDKWSVDDPEAFKQEIKEILAYWSSIGTAADMAHAIIGEKAKLTQSWDGLFVFDKDYYINYGDGHFIPNYPYLFKHGLKENIRRCEEKIAATDLVVPEAYEKKAYWEAVIMVSKAIISYAHRYAELAEQMAKVETSAERQKELLEIADICRWVPENPPRTLHEALQFVTFLHTIINIEDAGHSVSLGRADQYLYPFYQKDLEKGLITRDSAMELIENWFIKIWQIGKWKTINDARTTLGKPMHSNLTIGGLLPDGRDGTNDLTYMMLEAKYNTRMTEPQLTARWNAFSPHRYKVECLKVIRLGIGQPALFNDKCIIPAMLDIGYEQEEAYDYGIIGCVEVSPPGLLGGGAGGPVFNLSKPLELALFNGNDPRTGLCLYQNPSGKDLATFESYEELWKAYTDQTDFCHKMEHEVQLAGEAAFEMHLDEPVASSLGDPWHTIERGKGFKKGGSKYDFLSDNAGAVASTANALAAVRKLVFEEKVITGAQLKHALETNFEDVTTSPSGPEIRAMCINVPKFGNDLDYVDFIARDVLAYHCREVKKLKTPRYGRGPKGCFVNPSTSSASANSCWTNMGAMPDGRLKGQPPSETASPAQGELGPKKGLTGVIKSITKYLNVLVSDGQLVNYRILPNELQTDEGIERLIDAIDTCFDGMGFHMQFNVVDSKTLRDAQKNPDKYKGLMVRVAGYSAYFVQLDPEVQEDIISRVQLTV